MKTFAIYKVVGLHAVEMTWVAAVDAAHALIQFGEYGSVDHFAKEV